MANGTLFLIVGPSGVGKDTLIDGAKARLATDPDYLFPTRVITRPQSAGGEDHVEIGIEAFQQAKAAGEFALSWEAHGLSYGVPAYIAGALGRGQHVIVNVSRTVLDQARAHFRRVRVISISASRGVLVARLEARGRETRAEIHERIARAGAYNVDGDDVITLVNDGDLGEAISTFVGILEDATHASV